MRYLHVLDSCARGGVETTFLHLLRAFRATPAPDGTVDGHDVLAFAHGPLARELAATAHRLIVSSLPLDLAAVLANGYDVVHILSETCAHRIVPMILAGSDSAIVYAKSYDAPALSRMQGSFDHAADEGLLSASDAVTFTTLDLAAGYRLPPGRTTILRKAAPIADALALPPIPSHLPPRILAIAGPHPRKRIDDLVWVLQMIQQRVPRAELRIVAHGTSAQLSAIRERLAAASHARAAGMSAGTRPAITLADPQMAIVDELARTRVVALPSLLEGVATVALEAMAAARPVVAMRAGHIGHVMSDGGEGFLATPGDLTGFSARVVTLLEHPELALRMGAAGRARAATHDIRAIAGEVLRILRRAATARRRAAA